MINIYLNGMINVAPTELNKSAIQSFYYHIAPTEHKFVLETDQIGLSTLRIDGGKNKNCGGEMSEAPAGQHPNKKNAQNTNPVGAI